MLSGVSAMAQTPLFVEAEGLPGIDEVVLEAAYASIDGEPDRPGRAAAFPRRDVRIELDRLAAIREEIEAQRKRPWVTINLFEGVAFRAVFEETAPTSSGYSLSGRLEGVPWGTVTVVVNGDIVAGAVRTATKTYLIRPVGVGVQSVEEVEPATLDADDILVTPASVAPSGQQRESADSADEDDGSEIDVLVFYTRDAREALGGTRRTQAQIDLAVAETNAAYEAGGAIQRIRLVGAVETDYRETDSGQDLNRFEVDGDGHMDDVHAIRDAYAADLVHLVVECCGGLANIEPYDEARGFALSSLAKFNGFWLPARVFAHELGHNMGLRHDRYDAPASNFPFPYSAGYVNQTAFEEGALEDACWMTIMAYPTQCWDAGFEAVPLMLFSNPEQRYPDGNGDPMGVPGDEVSFQVDGPADAVRSLNETRTSVANFRASADRCVYRVSPASVEVAASGGSFGVDVEVDGASCPREAKVHDEFLALVPDSQEHRFRFRIEENEGFARFGTITIAGETIEVRQRGGRSIAEVCGRSAWLRDAITTLAGRGNCAEVTEFNVASIYELNLSGRGIEEPLRPGDLEGLVGLAVLDFRGNRLSGALPDAALIRNLQSLDLADNAFTGSIPPGYGDMERLLNLDLSDNGLTGPIPAELGNLVRLVFLFLSDNGLSGPIPAELGGLGSLVSLGLAGNELSGEIPRTLGSLNSLSVFMASTNRLSGPIPPEFGDLARLDVLSLADNELSGSIPRSLGELDRLWRFRLFGNRLTGCIPSPLGRFSSEINPQRGEVGSPERDLLLCPVPRPVAVTIEGARDGRLSLSYGGSNEGEPVSYFEYRLSADGGVTWSTDWTPIPDSATGEANDGSYTIEGLTDGTRYTVEVRGVNVDGPGPAKSITVALGAWMPGRVPLFEAANDARQGFVRVINHSDEVGEVRIEAVDDAGMVAEPVILAIGPAATVHFNADDLEQGDGGKGIENGIGPPSQGNWRLRLSSGLDLEILAYSRTFDGFVTSLHDVVPVDANVHRVVFFNPGRNSDQISRLRLVNPGGADAVATIAGIDDSGEPSSGNVQIALPAHTSVELTAAELESGTGSGIEEGALGTGVGKWRLRIAADASIHAMSLLESGGRLTNLSTAPRTPGATDGSIVVPLFPSASNPDLEGFVRVVNSSETAGEVAIRAFDNSDVEYENVTLTVGAGAAAHFNSLDLENGNPHKGLAGSTGAGQGPWRLELTSELKIYVFAYIRTNDGFVTAMHDLVPRLDGVHRVVFLNPASNTAQGSRVRLVNPGNTDAIATVTGVDGAGGSPGDPVRIRVPAGASVEVTSAELESGDGPAILNGALGDGSGKWLLRIESGLSIHAMSLLASPTGHLTNLSTSPGRGADGP